MKTKRIMLVLFVLFPTITSALLPVFPAYAKPVPQVVRRAGNPPPSRLPIYTPPEKPKEEKVVVPNEIETDHYVQTPADFIQVKISQFELVYGSEDPGDLLDVELTYYALAEALGREPSIREILYITIWSEYWFAVKGKTHALLGQEALARSYYHFCGAEGECSHAELMKFLSGYQPWFGNLAKVDMKHEQRADKLVEWLTNEFNYTVNGEEVYGYVDEILDVGFAEEQGWTVGKLWNRPSQWYGPAGPPPCASCVGSYTASYAIASIPYGGGYFYFVTYGQEQSFSPTALP